MRTLLVILLLTPALAAVAAGCSPAAHLRTPAGFVELDEDLYEYRAANADGIVLAVREMDNDPAGDLAFWAGALDRRLRERYQAEQRVEVEGPDGLQGIQIRYRTTKDGRVHRYWTTVFVTADSVYVVEAGGDAELFDAHVDSVEAALLSVDLG